MKCHFHLLVAFLFLPDPASGEIDAHPRIFEDQGATQIMKRTLSDNHHINVATATIASRSPALGRVQQRTPRTA